MKIHSNNHHRKDQSPSRLSTTEEEKQEILLKIEQPPEEQKTVRIRTVVEQPPVEQKTVRIRTVVEQPPEKVESGKPSPSLPDLKAQAKGAYAELTGLSRKTLVVAIHLGTILNELQDQLDRGEWGPFVQNQLKADERTLLNYRRLAEYEAELRKSENFSDMGIVEALEIVRQLKNRVSSEEPVSKSKKTSVDTSPSQRSSVNAEEPFNLADNSECSPADLGWKDGILRRASLTALLSKLAEKAEPEVASARQRIVIGLAGKINDLALGEACAEQSGHLRIALQSLSSLIETTLPSADH